jgi:hypothetical protein
MLANLLPGIREVRAPLAAGYLWLLTLWVALEPVLPDERGATGVVESLYRLADGLSSVGVGVAVSFAAYLVGSLSISLFGLPLGKWHGRRDLSAQARDALAELARATRTELERILSISGVDVEQLLDESRVVAEVVKPGGNPKIRYRGRRRRLLPRPRGPRGGPGGAQPRDFEAEQEGRIAFAVTRELDVIATTRLLGRDQELYSAIDRLRAETEFRRAIVPPIVFGGLTVGLRVPGPWWLLVGVVTTALAVGLIVDSIALQRRVNDLLLDVLTDNRVQSPTLERLRSRALAITGRTRADDVEQSVSTLAAAIWRTVKRLEAVGSSEPSQADEALKDATRAQTMLTEVKQFLPVSTADSVLGPARDAVTILTRVSEAWVAAMKGAGFDIDSESELARATDYYHQFLDGAKAAVADMRRDPEPG